MSLIARAGIAVVALVIASRADAVDGVLEINQVCASGSGCFLGDTPGFPVEITNRGSYRLTSNLTPPNQNTTVISISAAPVELDLNGFAIQGSNGVTGGVCSAPGTGSGVVSTVRQVAVKDGQIRGMGALGILLANTSRVERIVAEHNCSDGVRVGVGALVIDTIARANSGDGIGAGSASVVRNCVANENSRVGIFSAPVSGIVVDGCVANSNGIDGVRVGNGSRIRGCLTLDNAVDGISASINAQVLESVANDNNSAGIRLLGSQGTGDPSAIGLIVATGNVSDPPPPQVVGCSLLSGPVIICP